MCGLPSMKGIIAEEARGPGQGGLAGDPPSWWQGG